jgi:hypothetical protein
VSAPGTEDLEGVADRLDDISEQLADLAMSALRAAMEQGADGRPDLEKRITRARRSIEKAAALLRDRPTSTTI